MSNPNFSYSDDSQPRHKRVLIRTIERATGQPYLEKLYLDNYYNPITGESFWSAALRKLRIEVVIDQSRLNLIPKTGPLIVIANHPYGVLDGLAICNIVEQARSDFLILTHSALLRAPEARPFLLPVDFSGTKAASQVNLNSRKSAHAHLANGGCIVVFPAGAVSTSPDRLGKMPAIDWPWQPFTAQLIQRSRATVLPIFFDGQNSRMFQIASHISSTIRLSLIFKEVYDRIGSRIHAAIGHPINTEILSQLGDRKALLEALRYITYNLKSDLPMAPRGSLRRKVRSKPIILHFRFLKQKASLMLPRHFKKMA